MPALHVPPLHATPSVQHGSLDDPPSAHWLVVAPAGMVQTVPLSVHTWPGQQGSKAVPQDPQNPFAQTCSPPASMEHDAPGATHVGLAVES